MAKPVHSKVFPYKKETLKNIILHPETYKISDYKTYKRLDDNSWLEDYGDGYMMKCTFKEICDDRIILQQYPYMSTMTTVYDIYFSFKEIDAKHCEISITRKVSKGSIIRRISNEIDNHTEASVYYSDMLNAIGKCAARGK